MVVSLYVSLQMACHPEVAERLLSKSAKVTRIRKFSRPVRLPWWFVERVPGWPGSCSFTHVKFCEEVRDENLYDCLANRGADVGARLQPGQCPQRREREWLRGGRPGWDALGR